MTSSPWRQGRRMLAYPLLLVMTVVSLSACGGGTDDDVIVWRCANGELLRLRGGATEDGISSFQWRRGDEPWSPKLVLEDPDDVAAAMDAAFERCAEPVIVAVGR